jgi:hypothetical protein
LKWLISPPSLAGREILIPPNSPSDGVRVAFIVENGAPIELLEFTDPNHPGRRQQSKMLIETPSTFGDRQRVCKISSPSKAHGGAAAVR